MSAHSDDDNGNRSSRDSSRASSPDQSRNAANAYGSDHNGADAMPSSSRSRPARKSQGGTNNGAASTIGKIRHLKKEDGEPLWRKDIQYDFLRAVFDDEAKVFTNTYDLDNTDKQNFADLYIDTMARSSKTSKVLRDKLLSDREAAKSMAMVCLLVNVGRMNTTLNFFPEMRAQLRTYHAIPSLQAYQDATAYKQLQDAPRLKSILKGAAEDREEPRHLNDFKETDAPRTNPVNIIFLICVQAAQVAELHFPTGEEFHDLIMKTNYTSQSRAKAFLWLMWFYLESDFTEEGCEENPFGAGVDYGNNVANQGVPRLVEMTPEEEEAENIDPEEEKVFGREKQAQRAKIIEAEAAYSQDYQTKSRTQKKALGEDAPATALPRIRPSKHESDMDSTRSTPPPRALSRLAANSTGARHRGSLKYQVFENSSPAAPSGGGYDGIVPRKPRPPTAHQLAVERNRSQRIEHILDRGLRREHHQGRKVRRLEGAIIRYKRRLDALPDAFVDSDDEESRYAMNKNSPFRDTGIGGLGQLNSEPDQYGEEAASYAAGLRRADRRLSRWDQNGEDLGVVRPFKKEERRQHSYVDSPGPRNGLSRKTTEGSEMGSFRKSRMNGDANGDVAMEDADDLDDVDRQLLGYMSGGENGKDEDDDDEELDDTDKMVLGIAESE